jgi:hypothetical protein
MSVADDLEAFIPYDDRQAEAAQISGSARCDARLAASLGAAESERL